MQRARAPLLYLALALIVLARVAAAPTTSLAGFLGVDALDTAWLRALVPEALWGGGRADGVFFPEGYPALGLAPNLLDHLLAAPLVALLPFPLADNLWWLLVIWLNGLAGHRLGRVAGGSEAAGWLGGVAWMWSEPLLREANLHHAPQALSLWAPLFLAEVLLLRQTPSAARGARAGLLFALAALSYWYYGLFLALGAAPLLLSRGEAGRPSPRALGALVGVAALGVAPALAPLLLHWGQDPITAGGQVPPPLQPHASYLSIPDAARFSAQHGNDLLFWLRRAPLDASNRVSLPLIVAAALGAATAEPRARRALLALAGLGAVMVLGPYLRWGEALVTVGGEAISLPFRWLGQLHPALARLTWPERWGLLIPLGLIPLAARAAHPRRWAALIGVECLLLSANLPLQAIDLSGQRCWGALSGATGAIIELPLVRQGLLAPRVGVHARQHRRPVVNAMQLPPGAMPPTAWRAWLEAQPMMVWLSRFEAGEWPPDPGADAVRALQAAGVSAIAVDADPLGVLTEGGLTRYRAGLGRALGPPIDLGCAVVWWLDAEAPPPVGLDDGDAWRKRQRKQARPAPKLETLMAPDGPVLNTSTD